MSDLTDRLRKASFQEWKEYESAHIKGAKWPVASNVGEEAADEIDRLTRELAEAREALLGSMGLIDRMMHVHVAPDECTSYVEGSRRWFSVNGGSLAAIAEQQAINRVALKEKP